MPGARSVALPPPVKGWNARDALADMPEDHAVIMDNWFPDTDKVTLRLGYTAHATGLPGPVETILEYTTSGGAGKIFAVSDGEIYDATAAGSVGAAAVTGLANSRFQQVQIGTAGGHFLLAVNGEDTPQTYDGSAWADATMTGPTIANLIWCNLHQRRLWFGEVDSLSAWYLDVNAITGAASEFTLEAVAKLGGYIMAMGTWTRDAGDGQDDVAVFLTSEGEAIVYTGTDPSDITTWSLIGVFRIGKPIGRRCMIKAGGDLIMITQDGFVAASSILAVDRSQSDKVALSSQINKAVNDAVRDHGSQFGWQPQLYPNGRMLIFNIPQSTTTAHQHVFNTKTGAPCRFTGINALCWGMKENAPFFGAANGKVYQYDIGMTDDGEAINGDCLQAFNYFSSSGQKKAFKMVEPIFQSAGDPRAAIDLNLDFQIATPTGVPGVAQGTSARWGVSKWGKGKWGTAGKVYRGWRGVRGIGRAAALRVRVQTKGSRPSWVSTNFLFTPGGIL